MGRTLGALAHHMKGGAVVVTRQLAEMRMPVEIGGREYDEGEALDLMFGKASELGYRGAVARMAAGMNRIRFTSGGICNFNVFDAGVFTACVFGLPYEVVIQDILDARGPC